MCGRSGKKEGEREAEIKPRDAMIPRYVRIKKLPAKHKWSHVSEGRAGQLGGSSRGGGGSGLCSGGAGRALRPWQSTWAAEAPGPELVRSEPGEE